MLQSYEELQFINERIAGTLISAASQKHILTIILSKNYGARYTYFWSSTSPASAGCRFMAARPIPEF
jgi:hypothetical protein